MIVRGERQAACPTRPSYRARGGVRARAGGMRAWRWTALALVLMLLSGGRRVRAIQFCLSDGDCEDHDRCTTNTCLLGVCVNPPIDCNDHDLCTNDTCTKASGCQNMAIPPGSRCDDG